MKYRTDFVTNSSSSSFVCEICGSSESGWDMGLTEAGMIECVNGHTFCVVEATEEITIEVYKEYLLAIANEPDHAKPDLIDEMENDPDFDYEDIAHEYEIEYNLPEKYCPICQFMVYSTKDMVRYLTKLYGHKHSKDELFAEIKAVNKRRKKVYDTEYISWICGKYNLNPVDIVADWKEEFKTYEAFSRYVRS